MKQILLYTGIYSFTAEEFIEKLNEIPKNEDVTVRLNSPGGSVFAGWGIVAALNERTGKKILKVDGNASSMAFTLSLFFDEVHALDVTSFMVHRATAWIQNEDDQKMLDNANKALRAKMEKRIDKTVFKEVTGVTIKEIFEGEKRRDIWITAKDAKKIGLVDKVTRLDPREIKAIKQNLVAFSEAFSQGSEEQSHGSDNEEKETEVINKSQIKTIMTIKELQQNHPDIYSEIFEAGINQEKDRVQAWFTFVDVDATAVEKGIESGDNISQKVMAEMTRKMVSDEKVKKLETDSPQEIETAKNEKAEKTEKEIELAQAQKEIFESTGLKS